MASNSLWPLSGDVMQAWATMLRSMSQIGLVNVINETKAKDPDLERKIITEGYSYGSQLGRIIDAVEVLVGDARSRHIGTCGNDGTAFDDFSEMAAKVAAIKSGLPLSENDLDEFVRRMEVLNSKRPKVCQQIRKQLDQLQERLKAVGI